MADNEATKESGYDTTATQKDFEEYIAALLQSAESSSYQHRKLG
jgi:hypothetical protein